MSGTVKIQLLIELSQDEDGQWVADCDNVVGVGASQEEAIERLMFALAAVASYGVDNIKSLADDVEVNI